MYYRECLVHYSLTHYFDIFRNIGGKGDIVKMDNLTLDNVMVHGKVKVGDFTDDKGQSVSHLFQHSQEYSSQPKNRECTAGRFSKTPLYNLR